MAIARRTGQTKVCVGGEAYAPMFCGFVLLVHGDILQGTPIIIVWKQEFRCDSTCGKVVARFDTEMAKGSSVCDISTHCRGRYCEDVGVRRGNCVTLTK